MMPGWGLCRKCGWSDPNWSAEEQVRLDCPWLDPEYQKAFKRKIWEDGKRTMIKICIDSGRKVPKELTEMTYKGDE